MVALTAFPTAPPATNTKALVGGRSYVFDAPTVEWRLIEEVDRGGCIGEIATYVIHQEPGNWLICNGAAFDPLVYPALQTFLGDVHTPNLNNQFIRGVELVPVASIRHAMTTQGYNTHVPAGWSIAGFSGRLPTAGRHRHVIASSWSITGFSGNSDARYYSTDGGDGGTGWAGTTDEHDGDHRHTKSMDVAVSGWDSDHSRPSSISVAFYIRALVAF
jgi:hypothetical protein